MTRPPRTRRTALAAAAAGVLAAFGVACDDQSPSSRPADPNHGVDNNEAWVACLRYIVVGDVMAVHAAPTDGRIVVSLAAQDWLKPSHGGTAAELEILDPKATEDPPLKPGEHVLLVVAENDSPSLAYRGAEFKGARRVIERALPTAPTACPTDWSIRPDA